MADPEFSKADYLGVKPNALRYPNSTDDPAFYCHGQKCIDGGCDPLHCADEEGA